MHTANAFRGQAVGAGFFAAFGALWLTEGFYALGSWSVRSGVMIGAGAALLLSGCFYLSRQAKHWPLVPEQPGRDRAFRLINLAQWAVIAIAAPVLGHYHLGVYISPMITAVVGIHLFPLAKLFRRPQHLVNGIVLTLWACFAVLAVPMNQMQGVTAMGTGVILWTSAAISLAVGILAARRSAKEDGRSTSAQAV